MLEEKNIVLCKAKGCTNLVVLPKGFKHLSLLDLQPELFCVDCKKKIETIKHKEHDDYYFISDKKQIKLNEGCF